MSGTLIDGDEKKKKKNQTLSQNIGLILRAREISNVV